MTLGVLFGVLAVIGGLTEDRTYTGVVNGGNGISNGLTTGPEIVVTPPSGVPAYTRKDPVFIQPVGPGTRIIPQYVRPDPEYTPQIHKRPVAGIVEEPHLEVVTVSPRQVPIVLSPPPVMYRHPGGLTEV